MSIGHLPYLAEMQTFTKKEKIGNW